MREDQLIHLMMMAYRIATVSPDPSTQNGAIIVSFDGDVMCHGYNAFPRNVVLTEDRWQRPLKYSFIEHAERNVIFEAARMGISTSGLTMICPWFACADCARAIVQSGIIEVVGVKVRESNSRWEESIKIGNMILDEGGVKRTYLDIPTPFGISLRRNEKVIIV